MNLKLINRCAIVLIVLCMINCGKHRQAITKTISIEDSLRTALKIEDSIKILKVGYSSVAFLDYNRHSVFHENLLRFRGNGIDSGMYADMYAEQLNSRKTVHLPFPKNMLTKLYKLYEWDSGLYVYMDCEFQMVYQLADSAFIYYNMDGAMPEALVGMTKVGDWNHLITYDGDTVDIRQVDERPIYQIRREKKCGYYTSLEGVNNFEIIMHACVDETDDIIDFKDADCTFK
jgi:hypothetical protein